MLSLHFGLEEGAREEETGLLTHFASVNEAQWACARGSRKLTDLGPAPAWRDSCPKMAALYCGMQVFPS